MKFTAKKNMTATDVTNMCEAAGWKQFCVELLDGKRVYITPCSMLPESMSAKTVEYFLIDGALPWGGANNVDELTSALNRYSDDMKTLNSDRERLHAYYEENINGQNPTQETVEFYSDWYKDLYGHRPHLSANIG